MNKKIDTIITELKGFSGSCVYLMKDSNKTFVRKINNIDRNYERMIFLSNLGYNIPLIYNKDHCTLDIEYISGVDIKTYLKFNNIDKLLEFLLETIQSLASNSIDKDYTDIYIQKLSMIDFTFLPFTNLELLSTLPKILPSSNYYGDLTLENIIYSQTGKFYLIDPVTIEYDSWIFDIAKLRQDLHCKWFLRNDNVYLHTKLNIIQQEIFNIFPQANNDYLLILMLLRVYRHATNNSFEQNFLLKEIHKLWKL